MKLNLSNEWLAKRAAAEEGHEVSTGRVDLDALRVESRTFGASINPFVSIEVEGSRTAFGRLINLWRRQRGIKLDQLAERAHVDLAELITIERDVRYIPEPRTVYQLAITLGVPTAGMLQLSGNVIARDSHLGEEAVRFAARADSVEKLSADEHQALEEFVKYLSKA